MIYGVGTDLVHVPRIEAALGRFGDRFSRRILTLAEHTNLAGSGSPCGFLAKHFAAKEAFVKALGLGFRDGIGWRQIELRHDARGKPYLECSGRTREILATRGIGSSHLSLSDEKDYALAFVVLQLR